MRTKLTVYFMYLLVMLYGGTYIGAQVTIGSGIRPEKAAVLDIKEMIDNNGGPTVKTGGLILPRVNLEKKKQLYPFIRENGYDPNNYNDPDYNPDVADPTYAAEKPAHTGLIVYNLHEDNDEGLCIGLNQWDSEQWNCLQNKLENAVAAVECNSVSFKGVYLNDVALDAGNYMTINLNVNKAGAYTITAMPDPDNGYYFTYSGVFLTTGDYSLTVPGAGKPLTPTPNGGNGDLIKITFNGKDTGCDKYIKVDDSAIKPLFSMICESIKAKGVYKLDQPLIPSVNAGGNYLEIELIVDPSSAGATFVVETNTVDGIYFKGEGVLTNSASQIVKIPGYGTPNSIDTKVLTVSTNSQKTTATCKANVVVVAPKKRMLSIGRPNVGYSIAPLGQYSPMLTGNERNRLWEMVDADINYGANENSKFKYEGFNAGDGSIIYSNSYKENMPSNAELNSYLLGNDPVDIVVIGHLQSPSATNADIFIQYLNRGGVLIMWSEQSTDTRNFFRALFNNYSISAGTYGQSGTLHRIANMDDELLNGPFGDVRSKYWGEDASATLGITGIPENEIVIYSNGVDYCAASPSEDGAANNAVTCFRHRNLNLFWVGDGGFAATYYDDPDLGNSSTRYTLSPFRIDPTTKVPTIKNSYGHNASYRKPIQNSIFIANVLAWAIKQAEFHGINSKP